MTAVNRSDFWAQKLFRALDALEEDSVRVVNGCWSRTFGPARGGLGATISVHHPRFFRRVLTGGGLGAAESWIDGDWTCDDLARLVRIVIRNPAVRSRLHSVLTWPSAVAAWLRHAWRRNTRPGAHRNIHDHYDLGNEFFELFLDESLSYSCALFRNSTDTLDEAARAKLGLVCQKLELRPTDDVVEIGTGWGGLALFAAGQYGCQVTTTTISSAQRSLAQAKARTAGLSDRVKVLGCDYRDLTGQYDKLVSIEMIEAVGHEFLGEFFRRASSLLRPDGRMLLQAIVIKDQRLAAHRHTADFIRRHIFPGGCLPSVTSLCQAMAQASDLRMVHLEELSEHYVRTLRHWRARFAERIEAVRALGYSEAFIRKWNYYFSYCEAAFEERQVNVVQMLLAKPRCRLDSPSPTQPTAMQALSLQDQPPCLAQ